MTTKHQEYPGRGGNKYLPKHSIVYITEAEYSILIYNMTIYYVIKQVELYYVYNIQICNLMYKTFKYV